MRIIIDKGYAHQLEPVMRTAHEVLCDLAFDGGTVIKGIAPVTVKTWFSECLELHELSQVDFCIVVGLMETAGLVCINRKTGMVTM